MTNREFINQCLTDEELVEFVLSNGFLYRACLERDSKECKENCGDCILKWLKKEVEENESDKTN